MTSTKTAAIIVAAGTGVRSGSAVPKQYARLGGKAVLAYSYAALRNHPAIDRVIVVIGADQEALLHDAIGGSENVTGGATRRLSVLAGLEALANEPPAHVLIHDAARPFLSAAVIDRLIAALDTHDGAVPALPVPDTLARGESELGETVARDALHRIQTPQAFHFATALAAHRGWTGDEPTDDAQMLRAVGGRVALVEGDPMLEKITHPADFAAAESRLATTMRSRTATGFDVHRLEAGEELWLGGVLIPHDKGLSGHSDADVALHAITDALLGTIAAGDIGTHFPPSDPQWRGADSAQFLQHAASLIAARGGIIDFIDLTLICEAPKIGPHRVAMRDRIAELLRLDADQVSIKATTTERLGFTGRGEGIAAQAAATVRVPGER
ncbi:2-C-methyl-D-erythritol 4-phosphate cytidylyltransferase/2-C-methyl-D-erythritol 2,4-cyclodiphosphate synthase [Sphingomonas sp. BE270]|jgi:2-C-methyl-D-erythritol 4-phosphate cytidylyltransferase/2-C-methyl-D-erythritol 2,4-cyclodiphosphate synthase|uniref:bifunctional 2-C-methyl-D-erythritol 4-phosphate cytidylyltransferase/2-C-methyl-D-erythritol 2,4-cyclodiphosphate synthase n=1 Tax=unclassified Sphingomonas TaxID=196159 RepID=UPI00053EB111|nr:MULTISPECIES: bifunctional 2-C-methyl-D-erythritol 4-phosphate cytidylyltransferase/2-C-methyl-D-erythritol 2,4-cyclodiphosphate synthase [unclassified Sphingomonas]MDR6849541.1 2-C-methyl-D-erythritol 4-phosphate cytidylyltransferase/2-C-methyl-D-erythritol 2,4-cyclodiphosphate synthase [Sphingomonas sp. BE137]MDR7258838.1 2-C-methyl-D-erythritol 4-phosphate cytidylyltransferase/2-C-methyl-D-erythritol 2,4-cyclodiphosphate synthase [Sphingomonas sp. BE270]